MRVKELQYGQSNNFLLAIDKSILPTGIMHKFVQQKFKILTDSVDIQRSLIWDINGEIISVRINWNDFVVQDNDSVFFIDIMYDGKRINSLRSKIRICHISESAQNACDCLQFVPLMSGNVFDIFQNQTIAVDLFIENMSEKTICSIKLQSDSEWIYFDKDKKSKEKLIESIAPGESCPVKIVFWANMAEGNYSTKIIAFADNSDDIFTSIDWRIKKKEFCSIKTTIIPGSVNAVVVNKDYMSYKVFRVNVEAIPGESGISGSCAVCLSDINISNPFFLGKDDVQIMPGKTIDCDVYINGKIEECLLQKDIDKYNIDIEFTYKNESSKIKLPVNLEIKPRYLIQYCHKPRIIFPYDNHKMIRVGSFKITEKVDNDVIDTEQKIEIKPPFSFDDDEIITETKIEKPGFINVYCNVESIPDLQGRTHIKEPYEFVLKWYEFQDSGEFTEHICRSQRIEPYDIDNRYEYL